MPAFLAGLAALLILVFGARVLASANPQKLAVGMRMAGGILLLLVAAFLLARGAFPLAIPLAFFGLALLGLPVRSWFGAGGPFGRCARKSPGQKSRCAPTRSRWCSIMTAARWRDAVSRAVRREDAVLARARRSSPRSLAELRATDSSGCALIEAYLDRRAPGLARRAAEDAARSRKRRAAAPMRHEPRKRPMPCSGSSQGRARRRSAPRIAS